MTVWVRVRDTATGHHFDIPLGPRFDRLVAAGAIQEIPGRRHSGAANRPKPRRPLPPAPAPKKKQPDLETTRSDS